jgi:hypothetical protein
MSDTIVVIPSWEPKEWNRWLAAVPHDFYHTAAYHGFSEANGEGGAFLAVYGTPERFLAWPYLLRPIANAPEGGWQDVTSVYGYAGPLAHNCRPGDPFLHQAEAAICDWWASQKVVSAFSRFHPLLENHVLTAAGGLRSGGRTVSIDLTLHSSAHWHAYPSSLRHAINRARRRGFRTVFNAPWSRLDEFVRLYHATMERRHAAPWYFFSAEYFRRLKDALGPHAVLVMTELAGETAAAAIVIAFAGVAHYHLGVNSGRFLKLSPAKILLDDVRAWAKAQGQHTLHLGGGRDGEEDSLFAYKAGFSPRRHRFYTGRWVLAPEVYERLCRRRLAPPGDFFPAYRAPELAPAGAAGG